MKASILQITKTSFPKKEENQLGIVKSSISLLMLCNKRTTTNNRQNQSHIYLREQRRFFLQMYAADKAT
jgi:hypothetical protein